MKERPFHSLRNRRRSTDTVQEKVALGVKVVGCGDCPDVEEGAKGLHSTKGAKFEQDCELSDTRRFPQSPRSFNSYARLLANQIAVEPTMESDLLTATI